MIGALRDIVKDDAHHKHQLTDFYLSRWLVARQWNLEEATKMYKSSMQWRKEMNVDSIAKNLPKEESQLFEEYTNYWPSGFIGETLDGWTLYFEKIGCVDPSSVITHTTKEFRIKYNIWKMENLEKRRRKIEKKLGKTAGTTMVVDLSGIGWGHTSTASLEVFQSVSAINKLNYPETLRKSFIINAPSFFSMIWNLVSKWMDPTTKDKTVVLGGDYMNNLLEYMDISCIPSNLGGKGPAIPSGGTFLPNCRFSSGTKITIARSSTYEEVFNVTKVNSTISWHLILENNDIGFSVVFLTEGNVMFIL
uniref:CRAL-TRIO domain-containing protein n=1 Tax=Arcella intermedia TaxID=1963864 RepID=A0A6B2LAN7_9EUKA